MKPLEWKNPLIALQSRGAPHYPHLDLIGTGSAPTVRQEQKYQI